MDTYEKKYNEALEKAKEIKSKLLSSHLSTESCKAVSEYIDTIIPELRESEDERIRKELLSFIESVQHSYLCATDRREKWIAYLEKQKEEEGYEAIPVESTLEYKLGFKAGKESEKQKEPEVQVFCEAKAYDLGYEQGKEDAKKEQKPAEWSEEDEEMLEYIIGDVNDAKQLYTSQEAKDMADKEIAWLKSLRPSWKPSEEQMKALEIAFRKDGDDKYRSTINSLYNDLKKL